MNELFYEDMTVLVTINIGAAIIVVLVLVGLPWLLFGPKDKGPDDK